MTTTTDTFPPHSYTLTPADPARDGGLPPYDGARRLLTFTASTIPPLTDRWAPATLADGRTVEVRRADCGLGCRCAGEYRMAFSGARADDPAQDVGEPLVSAQPAAPAVACLCATHPDGSVTVLLCPLHADTDPCLTMSRVTGKRRTGTIRRGVCTACGWGGTHATS